MGEFSINGQYSNSNYYETSSKGSKKTDTNYTTFGTSTNPIAEDWKETFGLSLSPETTQNTDAFALAGVKPLDAERTKDIENFACNFETIYDSFDVDGVEETAGAEVAYLTIDAYQTGDAPRYESSAQAVDMLFEAGFSPEEVDAFMLAGQV